MSAPQNRVIAVMETQERNSNERITDQLRLTNGIHDNIVNKGSSREDFEIPRQSRHSGNRRSPCQLIKICITARFLLLDHGTDGAKRELINLQHSSIVLIVPIEGRKRNSMNEDMEEETLTEWGKEYLIGSAARESGSRISESLIEFRRRSFVSQVEPLRFRDWTRATKKNKRLLPLGWARSLRRLLLPSLRQINPPHWVGYRPWRENAKEVHESQRPVGPTG